MTPTTASPRSSGRPQQPWCDGSVGVWGLSYAANVALRTASRRPPALRAIIAVAHGLDPARDSVHPDGARGDLHALANRGSSLLLQQLLPPLTDSSPAGRRRWRQRLREAEPAFLDYARHGPQRPGLAGASHRRGGDPDPGAVRRRLAGRVP